MPALALVARRYAAMRKRLTIVMGAAVLLVLLAGGGAYVYFFSGLRSSPQQLGLSSTPTASADTTGLAGKWTVTTGSLAGYRVKELFVGETSKHDAVARTAAVSGNLTISGDASTGWTASNVSITADLTQLHSVDQVVGRNVTQRDSFVSRQMNLQQFPNATFTATTVTVPATNSATKASLQMSGNLTVHGVTKAVTVSAQAQQVGSKLEVAGSVTIDMTDYGVTPPQVPFTAVDSQTVIEFDVFLTKS